MATGPCWTAIQLAGTVPVGSLLLSGWWWLLPGVSDVRPEVVLQGAADLPQDWLLSGPASTRKATHSSEGSRSVPSVPSPVGSPPWNLGHRVLPPSVGAASSHQVGDGLPQRTGSGPPRLVMVISLTSVHHAAQALCPTDGRIAKTRKRLYVNLLGFRGQSYPNEYFLRTLFGQTSTTLAMVLFMF